MEMAEVNIYLKDSDEGEDRGRVFQSRKQFGKYENIPWVCMGAIRRADWGQSAAMLF